MCGIFGFITRNGEGPKIDRLRRIALITQSRGEHAFGLAWFNADNTIHTFKAPGPAEDHLDELKYCSGAQVVIGHCRFATHGSPRDNRNNHPHRAGKGYYVHNGVIHNHKALISHHGLVTKSECDSEVLGLLLARCPGQMIQRSAWAANQACGDLAVLGIWRRPTRLLIIRRGRPLHFGESRDGYYLASLPEGLPGAARSIVDLSAHILTFADGVLHRESDRISEGPPREPERITLKRGRIWI